jgi:uncharacterized protein
VTNYATTWWNALADGQLTAQHCLSCDTLQLYPRRRCVTCASDQLDYVPISGKGTVYSYSTVHRNPPSEFVDQVPYTLAIVITDEGPRMLTRLVNCDPESIRCDARVQCVITDIGGKQLVAFEPV